MFGRLLFLLAGLPAFCLAEADPQLTALAQTLQEMESQQTDPFVVVEIEGSDNFFQYASAVEDGAYIFDVPAGSMTEAQLEHAKPFFDHEKVQLISHPATDPTTGEDFRLEAYQKSFGFDQAEAGAALGLRFMRTALGYQEADIWITKGWE